MQSSGQRSSTLVPNIANLIGFRATITGNLGVDPDPVAELRVQMAELGRDENAYLDGDPAMFGTPVDYMIADAVVGYRTSDPPTDQTLVRSFQFQVASVQTSDLPFSFCVDNVEMIFQ